MADAMLDARQEGGSYRRIELITGERRRRRWTAEEKTRIVAESLEEGANISEVARRNGVVRGLLTVWRHKFVAAAGVQAPGFVPVRIEAERGAELASEPGSVAPAPTQPRMVSRRAKLGGIEIEVSGALSREWTQRRFARCCRCSEAVDDSAAARAQGRGGGPAGRLSQVVAHAVGTGERSATREPVLR